MESAMDIDMPNKSILWESLLHNRLNFDYHAGKQISFALQVRNRLIAGDRIKMDYFGDYKKSVAADAGIADLSVNLFSGGSYVFNTSVDRLWMKYARNKLEITLGRQRINWGQTFVWNPNDWFNNYSFFDVDYVERPGSDALRIQYYTGALSAVEGVIKMDSTHHVTLAGLYKTNLRQFDLQFLGGILSGEDLALGFGWSGGLGPVGFRGEMSYLHPATHVTDTTGLFFLSVAFDYTFSNSLMLQAEGFYSQQRSGAGEETFTQFYTRPSSVKYLSFTEFSFYLQAGYPITPLLNGSLALLYFPQVKGYYLGPALTYSLGNNLELALFLQYFSGEFPNLSGIHEKQNFTMGFGRVKWNF